MASLKKNIILNGLNTVTSVIFPVITFPYAARVLLPEGIGTINFLSSIISYITLFTTLGIPMYAVKEIAKYRDDIYKRNVFTVEILILSGLLCLCGYIAVILLAQYIPQIHDSKSLFYVLSISILFTAIGIDWFYQGIEDFKFITIRAIVVRILSAASLFIFVKDKNDLIIYGIILVSSTVGNNIINFFHLRSHLNPSKIEFHNLRVLRHIKPALQIFILNLLTSLYIQLNSIMLGFMDGEESVGFFTAGTKISHIGLVFIASISTVLFPRCANLLKKGEMEEFSKIIKKSLNVTLALTLPVAVGLILLAGPAIRIFCGPDYDPAVPVLMVNAPVIVFISLANVMGIQILYAMDKVNAVIFSIGGAALINLLLNFALISHYGAVGAAVSTMFAEFTGMFFQILFARRVFPIKISGFFNLRYIGASLIMGFVTAFIIYLCHDEVAKLIWGTLGGILIYSLSLTLMRDPVFLEIFRTIRIKLSPRNAS